MTVTETTYDYEACRTLGHAWVAVTPMRSEHGWQLNLRCSRCTMERSDVITSTGFLFGRRYVRPATYKHAKQDRSEWRHQFLNTLLRKR